MKKRVDLQKIFDLRMGIVGALFMGGVVYIVNHEYGFDQAITASLKQAAYTFLAGGMLMKMCENLARKMDNGLASILLSVLSATALSAVLTYGVHSLKGTPEPLLSTLVTILLAIPGFTWWAVRSRRRKGKI